MTAFERHKSWGLYRKHNMIKIVAFRLCNVSAMYAGLQFAFSTGGCVLRSSGTKFFSLILTDLVVMNMLEYISPMLMSRLSTVIPMMNPKRGDEAQLPEFDVAFEYLEVFYRQFVIYIGMFVFPMMALLGFITNVLELPLDKFRMLYVCQRPRRLEMSMKRFLIVYLLVTAMAALVTWPQGGVWMLTATRGRNQYFNCCFMFPDGDLSDTFDPSICTNT